MATSIFKLTPSAPVKALDAASGNSVLSSIFTCPKSVAGSPYTITWQITATGSPMSVSTSLLASLDGVNFEEVDSSTTEEIRVLAAFPAAFYQIELDSITGGTMPTVTVWLMVTNI